MLPCESVEVGDERPRFTHLPVPMNLLTHAPLKLDPNAWGDRDFF